MCCFRLHFSDFNVFFFKKIKNLLQFAFEKNNLLCKNREKNNLSRGKIPAPPWISNGPSLINIQFGTENKLQKIETPWPQYIISDALDGIEPIRISLLYSKKSKLLKIQQRIKKEFKNMSKDIHNSYSITHIVKISFLHNKSDKICTYGRHYEYNK